MNDVDAKFLYMSREGLFIKAENEEYFISRIDGLFPNYKGIIPDLEKEDYFDIKFDGSIKKVLKDIHKFMKIDKCDMLLITNDKLGYSFNDASGFDYEVQHIFNCDKDFLFGININYFDDIIKYVNPVLGQHTIKFCNSIRPICTYDDNKMIVIMPMKLK